MKTKLLLFFTVVTLGMAAQDNQLDWSFSSTDQQITINVGDTIVWSWTGASTHNLVKLTGPESGFGDDAERYAAGHTYSHTFTSPGVNTYHCSPHPDSMYGTVTVTATAGISENRLLNFSMYPNPVSDLLNIQLPSASNKAEVVIFDYTGRLVKSKIITLNDGGINVNNLSNGLYLIRVSSNTKVGVQKFIKK